MRKFQTKNISNFESFHILKMFRIFNRKYKKQKTIETKRTIKNSRTNAGEGHEIR
jgi:hypothetical protein